MSRSEESAGTDSAGVADDSDRRGVESSERSVDGPAAEDLDRSELEARLTELTAENRRLRAEYARAKRVEYRRSALALLALGALSVVGAFLFPVAREILFVLGATGLFGGALTWYLSPERFVTATVGRSTYEASAATGTALREELGLEKTNVYVPVDEGDVDGLPVRLFVPQSRAYELPETESLASLFVASESDDRRGVALRPTAARLVREFDESLSGAPASEPTPLAEQLLDALVEQFELADGADLEVDPESRRISVGVDGGVYGDLTEFDHPVASFLGAGMAFGLDRPVTVETTATDDRDVVTCRWSE